tara:strand:- start:642 stop:827 length:186 start_codon:yes stop_codon:yes gene_type:complete
MPRLTTVYYTLEIERCGRSGPENERRIEKFVQSLEEVGNPKDKYMGVTVLPHDYHTITESV